MWNIYIYIYTHTRLHRTQLSNSKGDRDTVLQFNNIQCYSLTSSRLGRMVLAPCRATLTSSRTWVVQGCWNVRALVSVPSSTNKFLTEDMNSSPKLRFLLSEFFYVGSKRLRKTALPIPHETPCNQHYGFPAIDFNFTHTHAHTMAHTNPTSPKSPWIRRAVVNNDPNRRAESMLDDWKECSDIAAWQV